VVEELLAGHLALVAFPETSELQGIVFAACAYVVANQVVVGDLVPPLGMTPEPAHVLDELAVMVDQHVVDRDHPAVAVTGAGIFLHPLKPAFVQLGFLPLHLGEEAIQARLIRGHGEFAVDPPHGLSRGHHQPGEIFREVPPLRLANEQVAELLDRIPNHTWKRGDPWHRCNFRDCHGHLNQPQLRAKSPISTRPI